MTIFEFCIELEMVMDNNTHTLPQIRLGMLPTSSHALSVDKIVIIDDNLLDTWEDDKRIGAPVENKFPIKIMMGITIVCVDGSVDLRLNQKDYHLQKNDFLLAMPGFIAEKMEMDVDSKIIVCAVAMDFLGKSPMKSSEDLRKWLMKQEGPAKLTITDEECDEFVRLYKSFRQCSAFVDNKYVLDTLIGFIHMTLPMINSTIMRLGMSDEGVTLSRKKDLVLKFLNDVHTYCNKERSVAFYADRCFLSPKYFARIMTEMLGKKPGDVIKKNVILEAKVMLISKDYTVQQVSDKLNFPNSSFFCKYFKSAAGCSPRQYQLYGEKATE